MEKVGGEGPHGQGEHKFNFLHKSTSQDQPSYLRSASAREPYIIPIQGRKQTHEREIGISSLLYGLPWGTQMYTVLATVDPKPRNCQLTHKPQILDSERAL